MCMLQLRTSKLPGVMPTFEHEVNCQSKTPGKQLESSGLAKYRMLSGVFHHFKKSSLAFR